MRAVPVVVCTLLGLRPTSARKTTQLVILHHAGHTGSHALCQLLGTLDCVQADCDEPVFDAEEVKGFRLASNKTIALRMYRMKGSGQLNDLKAQELVRFMPQVRRDLMRWSLSEYCKRQGNRGVPKAKGRCFEADDPQFCGAKKDPRFCGPQMQKHTYEIPILQAVANVLMEHWRHDADIANLGFPKELTHFVFYEDLLRAEDGKEDAQVEGQLQDYALWILKRLGLAVPEGCHRNDAPRYSKLKLAPGAVDVGVEKVHSNDIEDFVSNADEVRKLFASGRFPTWDDVAQRKGVRAALRRDWNFSLVRSQLRAVAPPADMGSGASRQAVGTTAAAKHGQRGRAEQRGLSSKLRAAYDKLQVDHRALLAQVSGLDGSDASTRHDASSAAAPRRRTHSSKVKTAEPLQPAGSL
jgi:hypothetical protein